jgi:hypothetical protein
VDNRRFLEPPDGREDAVARRNLVVGTSRSDSRATLYAVAQWEMQGSRDVLAWF